MQHPQELQNMTKIYDLEKERQKARDGAKEFLPPIICLRSKDRKTRIIPKMEKEPDGKWRIKDPEPIKAMLEYGEEKIDKEEKT
jgi:hypothetical protein